MSAKKWALILAAVFIVAVIATIVLSSRYANSRTIGVFCDGELYQVIYHAENADYTIEKNGCNVITVKDGRVYMSEADCPDRVCVRHGALRENDAIICVPNKVVVRELNENTDINAVTGR